MTSGFIEYWDVIMPQRSVLRMTWALRVVDKTV